VVSKRGIYSVRLSGLGDGDHNFSFELNEKFFAFLESPEMKPELEKGQVKAEVVLEKKPGLLALHFTLAGEVEVNCDRCLVPFMTEIESTKTVYLKLGEAPGEIEDDVIMIHRDDHEVDVSQLMYEFIVLALPYQRIHPEDENGTPQCDPLMLQKLEDHQGNREADNETDPRWDALKGIINNT